MSLGREGLQFISYDTGKKKWGNNLIVYTVQKQHLPCWCPQKNCFYLFSTLLVLTSETFYSSSELSSFWDELFLWLCPYQCLVGAELLARFPYEVNLLLLPLTVGLVSHLLYSHLWCLFRMLLLSHDFFFSPKGDSPVLCPKFSIFVGCSLYMQKVRQSNIYLDVSLFKCSHITFVNL